MDQGYLVEDQSNPFTFYRFSIIYDIYWMPPIRPSPRHMIISTTQNLLTIKASSDEGNETSAEESDIYGGLMSCWRVK